MIIKFKDKETEYQNWLVVNHNGYVINTKRYISKNYMPLHRATCYTISKYQKKAAKDAFTGICSKCNPDVSEQFIANKPF